MNAMCAQILKEQASRLALAVLVAGFVLAFSGSVWAQASDDAAATTSTEPSETTVADSTDADADEAAQPEETDEERISGLENAVKVLAEELKDAITATTVPEDREYTSFSGLGPAASQVYYRDKGLSIGGYGEVLLDTFVTETQTPTGPVRDDNIFDALRAVLYVGYKFNDKWLINSELEFEHAGTGGGGSVSVEFLTLDYMPKSWLNFRVGTVLIPMGLINEVHEPITFFGANRPEVERRIIPTTWRENGGGVFGSFFNDRVRYRMYAVNGLDARKFSAKSGLRGGRQKASEALVNDWAFVGRVDVDVINGLILGGSVYTGNSGQDQIDAVTEIALPSALTTVYELHGVFQRWGLTVKGLVSQVFIADSAALNEALGKRTTGSSVDPIADDRPDAIAKTMLGWYLVAAYDVLPLFMPETSMSLSPYFRYERVDTQNQMAAGIAPNRRYQQDVYVAGLQFQPFTQVVLKLDYQHIRPETAPLFVDNKVRFAMGYVF